MGSGSGAARRPAADALDDRWTSLTGARLLLRLTSLMRMCPAWMCPAWMCLVPMCLVWMCLVPMCLVPMCLVPTKCRTMAPRRASLV